MKMEKTFVIRHKSEGRFIRGVFVGKKIFAFKCSALKIALEIGVELGICFDYASLNRASLNDARLNRASLNGASLNGASLDDASLDGANIDFSSLPLWCGSLKIKTDERIRRQICFHFASLIKHSENATKEEKAIFELLEDYANGFHMAEEVGFL